MGWPKVNPFLPKYAVPVAPLYHFVIKDILMALLGIGLILFGVYIQSQIDAYQIADLQRMIAAQREQLYGKATADGLTRSARRGERP